MRAVLAGENADRQGHAGEFSTGRQIDVRLGVFIDLAGLAVEYPDHVVSFVGAIELVVVANVGVMDEGHGIADQPLFNLGVRQFRCDAVIMHCLDRFAVETARQHIAESLRFTFAQHREVALHAIDRGSPRFFAARGARQSIADLMAVIALADERLTLLGVCPRQFRGMRGGSQCVGLRLRGGKMFDRQIDGSKLVDAKLDAGLRIFEIRQPCPHRKLAAEISMDRVAAICGRVYRFLAVGRFVKDGQHRAHHGLAVFGSDNPGQRSGAGGIEGQRRRRAEYTAAAVNSRLNCMSILSGKFGQVSNRVPAHIRRTPSLHQARGGWNQSGKVLRK